VGLTVSLTNGRPQVCVDFLKGVNRGCRLGFRGDDPGEDHVWFEDRWMVASLCDE
jgi:hypothetical protein